MKEKMLMAVVIGSFLFWTPGLANAALITQEYYIEIAHVPSDDDLSVPLGHSAYYIDTFPALGTRYFGYVQYDDSNIGETGNYVIGEQGVADFFGFSDPLANELQYWSPSLFIPWNPPFFYQFAIAPGLYFFDGELSGIHYVDHVDMYLGIEDQGYFGMSYRIDGWFPYQVEDAEKRSFTDWKFGSIVGDIHFLSVPEPGTVMLVAAGLIAFAGLRRMSYIAMRG